MSSSVDGCAMIDEERNILKRKISHLETERDRFKTANETLREENTMLDKVLCCGCKNPFCKVTIRCPNVDCQKLRCQECIQEYLSSYKDANRNKEIFSCPDCQTNYPRAELQQIGGPFFLNALLFFQKVELEAIARKKKGRYQSLDAESITELVALQLPCCQKTELVDYRACCSLPCTFCKSATCAWCMIHMKNDRELGSYAMHEHIKQCRRNPNKGSYMVGDYIEELTVAMQSHQARQICDRLGATVIGDIMNGAHSVHS